MMVQTVIDIRLRTPTDTPPFTLVVPEPSRRRWVAEDAADVGQANVIPRCCSQRR